MIKAVQGLSGATPLHAADAGKSHQGGGSTCTRQRKQLRSVSCYGALVPFEIEVDIV